MAAGLRGLRRGRARGAIAVEVGLLITVFFVLVLGILDLARMMFLWSTLASATRRAAAAVATSAPAADHSATLAAVAFGGVPLSTPVIDATYFRVEYLNAAQQAMPAPASAADNLRNCTQDPQDPGRCVRAVRVRLCQPGSNCDQVAFQPLFPLGVQVLFPTFETVTPVGSLGYRPGASP